MLISSHLNQLFSTDSTQLAGIPQATQTLRCVAKSRPLRRVGSSLVVLLFNQTFIETDVCHRRDMQRSLLSRPFSRKNGPVTLNERYQLLNLLRRPLPMWTDGSVNEMHQRVSPSPTIVSRSSFFHWENRCWCEEFQKLVTDLRHH